MITKDQPWDIYQSPNVFSEIIGQLRYKADWNFGLKFHAGPALYLVIDARVPNSDPDPCQPRLIRIAHEFALPMDLVMAGKHDRAFWEGWIFEQVLKVERHEAGEFFRIGNDRPFMPGHGPRGDLYPR